MDLSDSVAIPCDRETVWRALNDADVLRQAIPGCQELHYVSNDSMTGSVTIKVGPIKATFKGNVTLQDIMAPESYVLVGEGKGGVAGFARGNVVVRLEAESAESTILHYAVNVNIGGRIAQVGARLLDTTAKKLTGQFFDNFNEIMKSGARGAETEAAPAG